MPLVKPKWIQLFCGAALWLWRIPVVMKDG